MVIEQLTNLPAAPDGSHEAHARNSVWDAPNALATTLISAGAAKKVENANIITQTMRKAAQMAKILKQDPAPPAPRQQFPLLPLVSQQEYLAMVSEEEQFVAKFRSDKELQAAEAKKNELAARLAKTDARINELNRLLRGGGEAEEGWGSEPVRTMRDLRAETVEALVDGPLPAGVIAMADPRDAARADMSALVQERQLLADAVDAARRRIPAILARIAREAAPELEKHYGPLVAKGMEAIRSLALLSAREKALAEALVGADLPFPLIHFSYMFGDPREPSHKAAYLLQESKERGFVKG